VQNARALRTTTAEPAATAPDRRAARQRVKAYRRRQRLGLAVLRVTVPEAELIAFLLEAGRLTETAALCRSNVEAAAGAALLDLARRWKGLE
jgi:hypothetical protein